MKIPSKTGILGGGGQWDGLFAKKLKVSVPRITQLKREIGDVILERWGSEVMQGVNDEPLWRSSLRARELVAV